MALPVFLEDEHNIGLRETAGSEPFSGMMIAGAYRKAYRRDLSDALQGVHYGADSLFNQPGISSWSMDDFTGGGWQQVWGKDPAMFSSCANLLPAQFDRSLRTVPPLVRRAESGVGGGVYTGKPLCFYAHGGYIVAFYGDRLYKVLMSTGAGTEVVFPEPDSVPPYTHAMYDRRSGHVLATYVNSGGGQPGVAHVDPLLGTYDVSIEPGGTYNTGAYTGIDCDGDRLVVASNDVIWTTQLQPNSTDFFDSTDWTRIGRLPAPWVASCWMGQLLYVITGGSDRQAALVTFDGVQVLPICDFPFNFVPESICAYAGRIYVGGSGRDISDGNDYGELYEVTGASLRLVKTFAPEKRSGRYTAPVSIHAMSVHEGLLFFGETGAGLIAYDVTTDSLYGAQRLDFGGVGSTAKRFYQVASARGRLWTYAADPTTPADNAVWSGAVAGDTVTSSYDGELITSEFGPELDRQKKWRHLRLLTRGDSSAPTVDASVDGGSSWTSCALTATEASGVGSLRTFDLTGIATAHSIRFRIRLPRGTSASGFAELVAFSAAYQLVDSDNLHADGTEKLAWTFTVAGVEMVELEDGSLETQRLDDLRDLLWGWATARTELDFRDLNGTTYVVYIDSLSESQPNVMPPLNHPTLSSNDPVDTGREAFYSLTLIEA